MSSLSSLDGVRRVFKELSDSLEAANNELIELRRENYVLRGENKHLKDLQEAMDRQYAELEARASSYFKLLLSAGLLTIETRQVEQ